MEITKKIISSVTKLISVSDSLRKGNKRIVLCQGHFNVIHPGHLRFLDFAKEKGDYLLVAIQGESKIEKKMRDKFYPASERARGIASLQTVDLVFIYDKITYKKLIQAVQPDIYVKGVEFSKKSAQNQAERELIEQYGGKVIFSSGDIKYSTTDFLDTDVIDIKQVRINLFHKALKKQNISADSLTNTMANFSDKHILVIGDTIVDQYVACDALGMSSEAPVLVVKEIENKEYIGGAAIIARHIRSLGAKCSFISVVGGDEPAKFTRSGLDRDDINGILVTDSTRSTTFKMRYMVGPQKILRVSRLKDHPIDKKIEAKLVNKMVELAPKLDGIIVSDFGYGVITLSLLKTISQLASKYDLKLFGDSQSSSQIGNVLKFSNYHALTPTEREARMALDDKHSGLEIIGKKLLKKSKSENIILTLGPMGFVTFTRTEKDYYIKTQHFPALTPHPVDEMGAGDSLLTMLAVSCCSGANIMEASALAAITASISVNKVGNIPVTQKEMEDKLEELIY